MDRLASELRPRSRSGLRRGTGTQGTEATQEGCWHPEGRQDAWARDWYSSADQAGDGRDVITGTGDIPYAGAATQDNPCSTKILA